ncbi:lipid-A-disaccharide synthase [Moraxella pluranimalium]|uniref:Lipid-A-disaccharide synthase n=1 Tax=Moraxella pluranimalium TaxID=470453 RepID=A0A1T0CMM8_9GAMM|nr:lipid-A-disaccharide synthase [Moraxella pluranimalium]OOS23575.1 lipid-A-disaccharide synthase [Moraxella pluranimalium]
MTSTTLPVKPLTIGIVAGEVSGDALGADFMQKMNAIHPHIRWVGVGGTQMAAQGLDSVIQMSRLSVMGLVEVVKHLPDLLRAKKEILTAFDDAKIDVFVGIDAPDFNLRLGKVLKPKGVYSVQYVSPSVWAWRENRIHGIKAATDLVLCLFPFELDVYAKHEHPAVCVGHPLLAKLSADTRAQADKRAELINALPQFTDLTKLMTAKQVICLMAGSRTSEINAILPLLIDSAKLLANQQADCQFILPVVSQVHAQLVQAYCQTHAGELADSIHIVHNDGQFLYTSNLGLSQACMNISDVVLLASGTATLECLLLERPMVVVYKVSAMTYAIAKRLVKIPYVSLPNILSHQQIGQAIVPELIQADATAMAVSEQAQIILADTTKQTTKLHQTAKTLRADSHANPAQAVLDGFYKNKAVL